MTFTSGRVILLVIDSNLVLERVSRVIIWIFAKGAFAMIVEKAGLLCSVFKLFTGRHLSAPGLLRARVG